MKGDFTRVTFDPLRHFSRVLMQQGRVQLDADWNEQVAIHRHYLRRLAADLIGDHGGPGDGFKIDPGNQNDFLIHSGRYYVDGILCENEERENPVSYRDQPDFPLPKEEELKGEGDGRYLVYLDVWEHSLSAIQEDGIREVALGGPDTAIRAKVVWQVKALKLGANEPGDIEIEKFLNGKVSPPSAPKLAARALKPEAPPEEPPCIISPESRYRGPENQLYRVEVQKGGNAGANGATFKWSRDNGMAVFSIRRFRGDAVILEDLGRDTRFGLEVGDWVEVVDDDSVLLASTTPLYRIHEIDPLEMAVTLEDGPGPRIEKIPQKHPLLRRWDQKVAPKIKLPDGTVLSTDGTVPIVEEDTWIPLEDGVEVKFAKADPLPIYRTGDYWLIPARTATGDVEWPGPVEAPQFVPPHGIEHHYAPLASITVGGDGAVTLGPDHRHTFAPIAQPQPHRRASQPPPPQKRASRRQKG